MKENQQIEWKETWRDEFLRWICAFADAEGGVQHIGRNDRGVVVGVPHAVRIRYEPAGLWVEFKLPPGEVAGLGEKLGERLGENRAAIIRAIAANPKVTVVQLADQLRISTTAVENNLRYLKTQNLIARIGAAKGGVWQVKETKP